MNRKRASLLILVGVFFLGPMVVIPRFVLAQQDPDCSAMPVYLDEIRSVYDPETLLEAEDLDIDQLESWTSADFGKASDIFENIRNALAEITPPKGAENFHDLMLRRAGTTSQMFDSLAAVGVFGGLGYADTLDDLVTQMGAEAISLELACNIAILDNDEDGIVEVGPGSSVSETISPGGSDPVSGTRSNPLPIGTTARLGEKWEITVSRVLPDAAEFILASNEYNDPPPIGHQYFLAAVKVSYVGDTSARFSSSRLKAVGQSSVAYEEYRDSCGQLPDELEDREIFSGGSIQGNVCWMVSSNDVESLVLYDSDSSDEDRVYLSLEPSMPSDLLVIPTPTLIATAMATPEEESQPPDAATPLVVASPDAFASPEAIPAVGATPGVVVVISPNVITGAIDAAVSSAGTPFVKTSPELETKDIAFVPSEITIYASSEPVTIKMKNTGAAVHNFSIDSLKIDVDVNPGETVEVVIPVGTSPGTYDFYCSAPGHKEAGMVGKLIVK